MEKYEAINSEIFVKSGQGRASVAFVYHADEDDSEKDKRVATLFSSAPDLLEALIAVTRVADRATDEFDLARAAIAKALGETK